MRISAMLVAALVLAGCGGTQTGSSFGDASLALPASPGADEAGVYFAMARDFDEAEGVTLQLDPDGDFRFAAAGSEQCIAVMTVVPERLVLCVDPLTLTEQRPKVVAVVKALMRGYTQAQLEPTEAVAAVLSESGLDVSQDFDAASVSWTAGAPYFGAVASGPGSDPSVAADARDG